MAKRNKTKKLFKSNLKLEALEQRQLLAGISGSGTELTPGGAGANNFIVASNGNHYDQVLLNGTSVTVTNDVGNITRVSFLDLQGDIVQAEFGGAGTLTVSLDPASALAGVAPAKYNQTVTGGYEQGLATFTIQGSDATTNFTVFSVGAGTAFAGNTLFDSTHTGGNNTADVQRLTIVANPANPNGSTFGGIRAGNAIFGAASGVVGISAANVQVQDVVTVGDIKATGTAVPTLVFGTQSQFGAVTIAGGGLVEANGASINDTGSYKFGLTFATGADSTVLPTGTANLPAQTAPVGLSFTGDNPVAAQVKTFTLTTGVDTIVGSGGNDSITGQLGGTPTLTALDSIDGGAGVNTLTINDVAAGGGSTVPGGVTVKNIQTLNLASAGTAGAAGAGASFDVSGLTGLTALNVVQTTGADYITAGSGQAVTVFDTAGKVTVTGGSTQTVTTAGGLALSGAAAGISATDTAQANVASTIDGGTTVDLKATAASSPTALVDTVTFSAMTAVGQTVTILGTTFTSFTGAETAATVAAAFAGHVSETGGAGVFWTSGAVTGTAPAGSVTFTATAAGVNDVKLVPTGTAPLPAVTEVASTGAVTIGNTTKPTGAITVLDTLNGGYVGNLTAGTVTVKGGTTVSVTEAPVTAVNPTEQGANFTVTQGSVAVTGSSATTSVTIAQAPSTAAAITAAAVGTLAEVDTVQFKGLVAGQKITVAGLTYVAPAGGVSADGVAAAFANLANSALSSFSSGAVSGTSSDTVTFTGGNSSTNVPYTGSVLVDTLAFVPMTVVGQTVTVLGTTFTSFTGAETAATVAAAFAGHVSATGGAGVFWTSGAVTGTAPAGSVTYTATAAGINDVKLVPTGTTAVLPVVTQVDNSVTFTEVINGHGSSSSSGRTGVSENTVSITDPNQGTGTASTITTVSLTNYGPSGGTSTIASDALTSLTLKNTSATNNGGATTAALTITNVTATTLDLTVDAGANGNLGAITNNTYATLKVHTTGSNTGITINDTAATTLTVDGSKVLSLNGASGLTKLATVAISGTAGFKSSTLLATVTDINASATSGNVSVTLPAAATTYEGGSGNDNVTITAIPTVAISGGAGADTLTLKTTLVGNPSSNTLISGFETLAVDAGSATFTYDATGFTGLANTSGQAGIIFSNVAAGVPLAVDNAGVTTYKLAADTAADALQINAAGDGTVTANGIEAVNIAVGGNLTVTLADNAVTSVVITNSSSGKNLTLNGTNTTVTSVDGSAMSGKLTYIAAGTTAETITGGSGADTLTASPTAADKLIGGPGNDTLTSNGYGNTSLSGGSGADTFVVATVPVTGSLNAYTTITDASVGDIIRLKDFGAEVFASGKISNLADTASFDAFANQVVINGGDASANGYVGWFQYLGNTYIVESMHNNATTSGFKDGTDLIVRLAGLIDLTNSAMLQSSGGSPEVIIR